MIQNEVHHPFMMKAIELGERGRLTAAPNPWVGCLIVRDGIIVGEGFHDRPGTPHAEPLALAQAGSLAKGATAYVNLEPCSHYGRTPPCAKALAEAGIKKVIIALRDPDPRVAGKGIALLQESGIEVIEGICEAEASESFRSYLHHRRTGLPYIIIKAAISIDGKTATADGSSQWISTTEALHDAHHLRAQCQAIMVGSGTVIADDPSLTVRHGPQPRTAPLRVVMDRRGLCSVESKVFNVSKAPTLLFTRDMDSETQAQFKDRGVEICYGDSWKEIFAELGKRGILQVLVEGGAKLHEDLLKEDWPSEAIFYLGPRVLGEKGLSALGDLGIKSMSQVPTWDLKDVQRLNQSVRLCYQPQSIEKKARAISWQ